jgi:alpha-L-rhamnosidase
MYEYLGGIRSDPEQPGFRHTIIRPYPAGDLTSVRAAHNSMYGPIISSWKRASGMFTLDVSIPPNTTATVWLPSGDAKGIAAPAGAKFLRSEGANSVYDIGSGSYTFRARVQ